VGGALGVAVFGTLVGGAARFVDGMRVSLVLAAGALALGMLIALVGIRAGGLRCPDAGSRSPSPSPPARARPRAGSSRVLVRPR
jgi:hypothetical protein